MPDLLLGLDLGTTRVTALAVDLAGRVRGRASQPLATSYPAPGRVEQDPEQMIAASREALCAALREAGNEAADVVALGLAAQRATAIAWDAETRRALAPAIGWQDQRTAARAAELARAGERISPLASATKFEWWLQSDEAPARLVQQAARAGRLRFGTPDVWLAARLSADGAAVTDPGHASCTALYDSRSAGWDAAALARFGIDPAMLPTIVATAAASGATDASLFGSPVPIAARAGDQQAAAFAQGVHARGSAKLTLGTSAMLDVHAGDAGAQLPSAPGAHALALWRLPGKPRDALCLEGQVLTAGAALDWLARAGVVESAEGIDAALAPTSGGAWFVPALQGLGTPHMDFGARGLLGGLSLATGKGEIARAVLEGVVHRCVDLCQALGFADTLLAVDGGLARSDALLQLLADLLGTEVRRAAELETTALGAAMLGGLAVGALPDLAACRALAGSGGRLVPRLADAARREARDRWQEHVFAAQRAAPLETQRV